MVYLENNNHQDARELCIKYGKNDPDHIVVDVQSNPFGHGIEFTEGNTAPVEVESHLLKIKRVNVIVKKLKFPLKESYVGDDFKDIEDEDDTSKDRSLGLILTDSKDELISSPQKDVNFNLVEDLPNRKRVVLLKSTRRHENCKYGFSKFELQHNTLNLDKYFISMRRKRYRKRRPFKEINLMKNAGGELKFKAIGLPPENALNICGKAVGELTFGKMSQDVDEFIEEEGFEITNTAGLVAVKEVDDLNHNEDDESLHENDVHANVEHSNTVKLKENEKEVFNEEMSEERENCNTNNLMENETEGTEDGKSAEIENDKNNECWPSLKVAN